MLEDSITRRRALLIAPFTLSGIAALSACAFPEAAPVDVSIVEFDNTGHKTGAIVRKKVTHSDGDWRRQLTAQQYWSARRGTTDTPFTGTYFHSEAAGLYRCICCSNALFSSTTKFDSATGWPSYTSPLAAENIYTQPDNSFLMHRIEVLCRLCDAHLGHLFDDGPPPTGLRYCINESALHFVS